MQSILALAALLGMTIASPINARAQVCNGEEAFCGRKYSDITFIGAHDSAFVGSTSDPRINQEKTVQEQLDAGIRWLEVQAHQSPDDDNVLELCHTSCFLEDSGPLQTFLETVKNFLDANPNEVVTVLMTSGDDAGLDIYDNLFKTVGLKDYAFVPSTSPNPLPIGDWPTLSEMISSGKRLVAMLDYKADESRVPYLLNEFAYYFETPYDTTDKDFNECKIDRPAGASPDGRMYIMNHFLDKEVFGVDVPDNGNDYRTNAAIGAGSIGAQADLCRGLYSRNPNVVLVDMFDRGDVFTAQRNLNGL